MVLDIGEGQVVNIDKLEVRVSIKTNWRPGGLYRRVGG